MKQESNDFQDWKLSPKSKMPFKATKLQKRLVRNFLNFQENQNRNVRGWMGTKNVVAKKKEEKDIL